MLEPRRRYRRWGGGGNRCLRSLASTGRLRLVLRAQLAGPTEVGGQAAAAARLRISSSRRGACRRLGRRIGHDECRRAPWHPAAAGKLRGPETSCGAPNDAFTNCARVRTRVLDSCMAASARCTEPGGQRKRELLSTPCTIAVHE